MVNLESLIRDVQKNCDASDAKYINRISDDSWQVKYNFENKFPEFNFINDADLEKYKMQKRKDLQNTRFSKIKINNQLISPEKYKTINNILNENFEDVHYWYFNNSKRSYPSLTILNEIYELEGNLVFVIENNLVYSATSNNAKGVSVPPNNLFVSLPAIRYSLYSYLDIIRTFGTSKKHKEYFDLMRHILESVLSNDELLSAPIELLVNNVCSLAAKIGKQVVAYHENGHLKSNYIGNFAKEELMADAIKKPCATGTIANIIKQKDSVFLAYYFTTLLNSPNSNKNIPKKWFDVVYEDSVCDINWSEVEKMRLAFLK